MLLLAIHDRHGRSTLINGDLIACVENGVMERKSAEGEAPTQEAVVQVKFAGNGAGVDCVIALTAEEFAAQFNEKVMALQRQMALATMGSGAHRIMTPQ